MISGGQQEAIHGAPALLMCDGDRYSTILLMAPDFSENKTLSSGGSSSCCHARPVGPACAGAGGGEVPGAVTMNGPPATCNVR